MRGPILSTCRTHPSHQNDPQLHNPSPKTHALVWFNSPHALADISDIDRYIAPLLLDCFLSCVSSLWSIILNHCYNFPWSIFLNWFLSYWSMADFEVFKIMNSLECYLRGDRIVSSHLFKDVNCSYIKKTVNLAF